MIVFYHEGLIRLGRPAAAGSSGFAASPGLNPRPHLHFLVTEGGPMKVIAFLTEDAVADRIIDHLKLTFIAAKPPPSHVFAEVAQ